MQGKVMKNLGIGLFALAWASCAHGTAPAHDYWYLGVVPSDRQLEYADADSIARTPGGTIVTVYDLYPGPESALSNNPMLFSGTALPRGIRLAVAEVRFECAKHAFELVSGAFYDSHGAVLARTPSGQLDWLQSSVEGGTSVVEAFACNDAAYREQHFRRARPGEAADLARPGFQPSAP